MARKRPKGRGARTQAPAPTPIPESALFPRRVEYEYPESQRRSPAAGESARDVVFDFRNPSSGELDEIVVRGLPLREGQTIRQRATALTAVTFDALGIERNSEDFNQLLADITEALVNGEFYELEE